MGEDVQALDMAINKEGRTVNVYDTIRASAIEENDLILHEGDQLVVNEKVDSGEAIFIKGESFITGDVVNYIISADQLVDLWTE